ncbi:MAG TPA: glycosyltransferase 87 family protein, partial [Kribbella sp.]|nr:glycosyltransferase 87 family protein [Kribbella sp.]
MVASVATGATILAGALAMPDGSRQFWRHYLLDPSRPGATHFVSNQAWRGVFARIAGGVDGIGPAWIVAVGITLAIGYVAVRKACSQGDLLGSILLAAVVGLLVSPISGPATGSGRCRSAPCCGSALYGRTVRAARLSERSLPCGRPRSRSGCRGTRRTSATASTPITASSCSWVTRTPSALR